MTPALASPELDAWAAGFPVTLLHVGAALAILGVGVVLYGLITPYRELQLVRDGNPAAAVSLGGVLVGLALPLAFAVAASVSLLDIALWGVTSLVLQLALFGLVDLVLSGLPQRIREGDVAAAVLLVGAKLALATILAGSGHRLRDVSPAQPADATLWLVYPASGRRCCSLAALRHAGPRRRAARPRRRCRPAKARCWRRASTTRSIGGDGAGCASTEATRRGLRSPSPTRASG